MTNTAAMRRATMFHSVRARTAAVLVAVAAAVALPELFHAVGALTGAGTALGQTFLPMHLPILLVGLLAGPAAGAAAGSLAPAVSFLLSGMPAAGILPFMAVELAAYGLAAGLLACRQMPVLLKVLLAQLAGRVCRMAAVLFAGYVLGIWGMSAASVWTAVAAGLPGLVLQWCLIPVLMLAVERLERHHD